jgi:hypothetical protein
MSSFYNCDKENIIISNRFKRLTLSNRRFNKYYVSHDKLNTLTKLVSYPQTQKTDISVGALQQFRFSIDFVIFTRKQTPQVTRSSTSVAAAILHLLLP